jgi:hypothetical protein
VSRPRTRTRKNSGGRSCPSPRPSSVGSAASSAAGELSEIIHRFHQGPTRELFARYNTLHLEMTVAYAITVGVLEGKKIPAELRDHLACALEFYEGQRASKA